MFGHKPSDQMKDDTDYTTKWIDNLRNKVNNIKNKNLKNIKKKIS